MSSGDEQLPVPSPSTSYDAYQLALQSAAVSLTKVSMSLPKDISYYRSLDRNFGKRLDAYSDRILSLASRLLDYADVSNDIENSLTSRNKGKRRLETEEDVVDGFHSRVVDVLDQLLERADTTLDQFLGRTKAPAIPINLLPEAPSRARAAKTQTNRLDPSLTHASHLSKPQALFRTPVNNKNVLGSWRPSLRSKPHAIIPLENSITDSTASSHPYQHEISNLSPPSHLINTPLSPFSPAALESSPPATYISCVSELPALLGNLKQASEIAVDLEHHSYRSFSGFVCLMQISTRSQDWIVDCLDPEIRVELECLNEVFADPNIVKVFHGAESDIVWLQQDFNIYVVNLFDTYHASKVLDFPKHSLAALLEMFCDFTPDKRYQLADWRIRPLPEEMLLYARSDTHFLLYIYDHLRNALNAQRTPPPHMQAASPLLEVIRRSSETSLRTYVPEYYDAENGSGPGGWEALSRKWNKAMGVGWGVRGAVFRIVHAWRDRVAREEDESTRYVLPNHYLFSLAERPPSDLPGLLAVFRPVPPLVRSRSLELLDMIKEAVKRAEVQTPAAEPIKETEMKVDEVRVIGSHGAATTGSLWDRLKPLSINIHTSSSLFGSIPIAGTSSAAYSTQQSTLFGPLLGQSASIDDKNFHDIAARIHSNLVLAPTLPKLAHKSQASISSGAEVVTPQSASDVAIVAEIPYVAPLQRQSATVPELDGTENIVVVGQRQKKRKRKDKTKESADSSAATPDNGRSKKRKGEKADTEEADIVPFDFDSAPNILDAPTSVAAPGPTKRRREKGTGSGIQYGNFGRAPRNPSEVKSGNQARTFG